MTITNDVLTLDDVLGAMKAVVDNHDEDFGYLDRVKEIMGSDWDSSRCLYQINGKPACLVGMVLDHLGILTDALSLTEDNGDDLSAKELLDHMEDRWVIEPEVRTALHVAQERQDGGNSWLVAYQDAVDDVYRDDSDDVVV